MDREKELKDILLSYTVEQADKTQRETTLKKAVCAVESAGNVPKFSITGFLKGQLRFLRVSFWAACLIYFVAVCTFAFVSRSLQAVTALCAATPLLAVAAVPTLFYDVNPMGMELESACLYKPRTVFAAKTVICAAINLLAVTVCSIICAHNVGVRTSLTLVLGLLSFLISALITLVLCAALRTQTGLLVSIGLFCAASGLLLGNNEIKLHLVFASLGVLLAALATVIAALCAVVFIILRGYDFERLGEKIEA